MNEIEFYCGLDLGQASDYTALAIGERIAPFDDRSDSTYHFRHIERLPLGTSYPAIVSHVARLVNSPQLQGRTTLALDYTGVGRPVFDMFTKARLTCDLRGVSVHGGDAVTWDWRTVGVPKRDLIAATQVLLQTKRLEIAGTLPDTATLVSELQNYQVKIDPVTAHDSYAAWREGGHDDLVFAVCLACWLGENERRVCAA
jgi:hypothetical protein